MRRPPRGSSTAVAGQAPPQPLRAARAAHPAAQRTPERSAANQQPAAAVQNQPPRALRTQAVSARQVTQGRFASGLRANGAPSLAVRRSARGPAGIAHRVAVWPACALLPWRGPVYWPTPITTVLLYVLARGLRPGLLGLRLRRPVRRRVLPRRRALCRIRRRRPLCRTGRPRHHRLGAEPARRTRTHHPGDA